MPYLEIHDHAERTFSMKIYMTPFTEWYILGFT